MRFVHLFIAIQCCLTAPALAQPFYFGADLSYTNQMEDCGVVYRENGAAKDPFLIFADNNCNLVRLRLWHTPAWQDTLDNGVRYSDFADVRRGILRAKASNMKVLLDFHLSDTWADPSRQLVPNAWLGVVNNLPLLKDSLYNYVHQTLMALENEGLLPEMVQIGNETNRGILLSPQVDAAGWSLDWTRNSQLFNRAIQAVRDVESSTGKDIKVVLHVAGPVEVGWLMQGFWSHGVTDFDIIGMSYYWAWHKPTTIAEVGNIITQMHQLYPGKAVMVVETAYIWTTANNDNANNIISEVQPGYAPASPENQQKWLIDLAKTVVAKGGIGVIPWEPSWVSSLCHTPWGQGSHQEHAAFFDFQSNVLPNGGMFWMTHDYGLTPSAEAEKNNIQLTVLQDSSHRNLQIFATGIDLNTDVQVRLFESNGRLVKDQAYKKGSVMPMEFALPSRISSGVYFLCAMQKGKPIGIKKVNI